MRRLAALLLVPTLMLLLTGCFRVDGDLTFDESQQVTGEVAMALDRRLADYDKGQVDKLLKTLDKEIAAAQAKAGEGITYQRYEEGDYVGVRMFYDHVSLEDFNKDAASGGEQAMPTMKVVVNDEGQLDVTGRMDLTAFDPDAINALRQKSAVPFGQPTMMFKMTMPGVVVESTGVLVDRSHVTWRPVLGFDNTMHFVAEPTGAAAIAEEAGAYSAKDHSTAYYTVRAVAQGLGVTVLGIGFIFLMRWNKKRPKKEPLFPAVADSGAAVMAQIGFVPSGPPVIPPPLAEYAQPEDDAAVPAAASDSPFGGEDSPFQTV